MSDDGLSTPADVLPPLADTSAMKEPPTTARGARTRAALVTAARVVFERDGYLSSRLTDITAEAKCSVGTFYTYFATKEEVFWAVIEAAQDEMLHPGMPRVADADDPIAVIEASNRAYLTAFRRNARLMAIMQQVETIDPAFQELRRQRALKFNERNSRHIAELQARGIADPHLDPLLASKALSGMVGRTAMEVMVKEDRDLEDMVALLTRLWANALRIPYT